MTQRIPYRLMSAVGLAFLIGLILGLWIGKASPTGPNKRKTEDGKFKAPNVALVAEKEALTRQVGSLKTQLSARDQEIENLKDKISELVGSGEELERLRAELARQQEMLVKAEKDLSEAREWAAFLESGFPLYNVIRETSLLRNPYENAEVISRLSAGRKVRIKAVINEKWLKVHYSRSGIPPGYIRREDAVPVGPGSANR